MRLLHCLNIPLLPSEIRDGGSSIETSGGWMAALLGKLYQSTDFCLACLFKGPSRTIQHYGAKRLDCYSLPAASGPGDWARLVKQWKPDIIHVHGTENAYGLLGARNMVPVPVVISLQGLMGPYSEWYHYFGNRSLFDVARMHRFLELPLLRGQWAGFLEYRAMAKREREIVARNRYFMGRTEWDRAFVRARNPSGIYYHAEEMLRQPFFEKQWTIGNSRRHRVIFSNGGHPRKGIDVLLDAIEILKQDYPDIEVAIAGTISDRSGYGRYVRARISAIGSAAVRLGALTAERMAEELVNSHVFVSPSFIDNSPNAVCEAQLLGMPVISSYVGGVPSLIEDGRNGLFFPCGDPPMLAAKLRSLFEDDDRAARMGEEARRIALQRHEPDGIVRDVAQIYREIVDEHAHA